MSTDRELLELAAKAGGYVIAGWVRDKPTDVMVAVLDSGKHWQPMHENTLTDCMGDALRLAVKLASDSPGASFELSISKMWNGRGSTHAGFRSKDNPKHNAVGDDIASTTRRAIVQAAVFEAGTYRCVGTGMAAR